MRRVLGLVLLLLACDSPVKPFDPQLNVFCVLRTDDVHPFVLVGKTVSYDGERDRYVWNGVADASVLVTSGRDSTQFRYVPETTGYYIAESLAVDAGRAYHLAAGCPDCGEARGRTTVPGGFAVESLHIDTLFNPDTRDSVYAVTGAWSASEGAAQYQVIAAFLYSQPGTDTAAEYRGLETAALNGGPLWASLRRSSHGVTLPLCLIRLSVSALDRNYTDYLTMQRTTGYRNTLMHIDGGLGVFGSICVAETTLYLTPVDHNPAPGRHER